jgi:S-adenosylmethionine-dependent methyltransferase
MDGRDWLARRFQEHRPRLRAVAYRMLGSTSEADDAVQEAWFRLSRSNAAEIDNLQAWLVTVVGRVALNVVRYALVARQLEEHLLPPPARIADVGGGAGQQTIPLARRGYEVTILDPSPTMLGEARRTLASEVEDVRRRVKLVRGEGERGIEILGEGSFDAVLCHGVLMHLEDPRPMIHELAALARPEATVSVLAKNASALAMRPALEARYKDALSALDADRDLGGLGVETRGDTLEGLSALFEGAGLKVVRWYGVRVFTDHLGDQGPGADLPEVLELEWQASRRDPYRCVARLIHLIGQH